MSDIEIVVIAALTALAVTCASWLLGKYWANKCEAKARSEYRARRD